MGGLMDSDILLVFIQLLKAGSVIVATPIDSRAARKLVRPAGRFSSGCPLELFTHRYSFLDVDHPFDFLMLAFVSGGPLLFYGGRKGV